MSQTNGTIRIGAFSVDFSTVLGKGATGYVYKGYHTDTFEPVAVKAIQMSQVNNEVTQYLLDGQKKAMSTIKSPYVIKTLEIIQQKDYCYIVMELCSNGTLKEQVQKKGPLPPSEAIEIFKKLVIGYISIIDALFIHRDLKTANIMLKQNGDPVIIDFGYCQMIMGKRPLIQYNVGSPSYMSPQAYTKNRYSQKSDIWALGVVLYEMLTGTTLDKGVDIKEFFRGVEMEGRVRVGGIQGFGKVCSEILEMALQVDPEKRATIHKLKYIIDKSLIPQMQAQLKKAHSQTSRPTPSSVNPSGNLDLKFMPPTFFNYPSVPKTTTSAQQKKEKINEHLKFLRGSDQFSRDGSSGHIQSFNASHQERNQQSLMQMGSGGQVQGYMLGQMQGQMQMGAQMPQMPVQNLPPSPHHHPVLRKSLDRRDSERIMKKIMSVKEVVELKPSFSFKKVPAMHKATSLQCTPFTTPSGPVGYSSVPNREGAISMRII